MNCGEADPSVEQLWKDLLFTGDTTGGLAGILRYPLTNNIGRLRLPLLVKTY
jgi:hypothetical protein